MGKVSGLPRSSPGTDPGEQHARSDLPRALARPWVAVRACVRVARGGTSRGGEIRSGGTSRARTARSLRPISMSSTACTRWTAAGSERKGTAGTREAIATRATRQKCDGRQPGAARSWRRWAARARGGRARGGRTFVAGVQDDGGDDRRPPAAPPRRRTRRAHRLNQLVRLWRRCESKWGRVKRVRSSSRWWVWRWWEWPQ